MVSYSLPLLLELVTRTNVDNTTENLPRSNLYDGYGDWKSPAHRRNKLSWDDHGALTQPFSLSKITSIHTRELYATSYQAGVLPWMVCSCCVLMLRRLSFFGCVKRRTLLFYFWRCRSCEQTLLSFNQKFERSAEQNIKSCIGVLSCVIIIFCHHPRRTVPYEWVVNEASLRLIEGMTYSSQPPLKPIRRDATGIQ